MKIISKGEKYCEDNKTGWWDWVTSGDGFLRENLSTKVSVELIQQEGASYGYEG